MPHLRDALRFASDTETSEGELRRACAILTLDDTGGADMLRARLRAYLVTHDPARPVVCLNPGPVPVPLAQRGPRLARPGADEHAAVFADEIALVPDAPDFAALLQEQLDITRALAATFGEGAAGLRYAPDKWTVRQTIGHLADCERVLSYRLLRALRSDGTALPGFDHVAYVQAAGFEDRALSNVMEEFAAVRGATVELVCSAPAEAFQHRLAVGSGSITARALTFLIAGHERHQGPSAHAVSPVAMRGPGAPGTSRRCRRRVTV